ncbi:MAG: cyclic nucleotide-binding domain-containing protein [Myxococcota bacterium]|jgi:CRP-like cAMP-binding protein|nr:cyclic nucleotide-binding domain-containing protein [Myxococcota bacterium]
MSEPISTILERHELFKRLSDAERDKLCTIGRVRSLKASTVLFRQDEASSDMFLLVEGSVKLSRLNRSGQSFVLARLQQDDLFGDLETLDGGLRAVTAETASDCVLVQFEASEFRALLARQDRAALQLLYLLCIDASKRLRELNRALVDVLNEPAALTPRLSVASARPDSDFFNGLLAGLFAPVRGRHE